MQEQEVDIDKNIEWPEMGYNFYNFYDIYNFYYFLVLTTTIKSVVYLMKTKNNSIVCAILILHWSPFILTHSGKVSP